MNELRRDLDDTAAEAGFYLDAEGAMRGADRHRRRFRLALVPVVAAVVGVASVAYAGLAPQGRNDDTATDPVAFASLGADVLDDAGGVVHTADGRTIPLPHGESPWVDGAKIPLGWVIRSATELRVLSPDGESRLLADGPVGHYAVSRDGARISWRIDGAPTIDWIALDAEGHDRGGKHTLSPGISPYPAAWAGEQLVTVTSDSRGDSWSAWVPDEEQSIVYDGGYPGRLLGVNARDEMLFTSTERIDGKSCQLLRETDVDFSEYIAYSCWDETRPWGAVSPDGSWLTLGGSGFLDLTVPREEGLEFLDDAGDAKPWPIRDNCGGDGDTATWVAADATVVERGGDWYLCTVDGRESAAVKAADHPPGKVLPVYGV